MSKVTLYDYIYNILKERILFNEYAIGTLLPTEQEMSKEFEVSLVTVRRAIDMLQAENYVEKKSGKGTTVVSNLVETSLTTRRMFESIVSEACKLEKYIIKKVSNLSIEVEGKKYDNCCLYERIYHLDGVPFAYMKNYFTHELGELVGDSLYLTLYKEGVRVNRYHDKFTVGSTDTDVFDNLKVETNILKRVRTSYQGTDKNSELIEFSEMYYNSELHPYEFEFINL